MKQRLLLLFVGLAALMTLAAGKAQAQVPFTITFAPDTLIASPSDLVYYTATFANTSATDYFVDGASFNSSAPNAGLLQGFFNGDPNTGAFEVLGNASETIPDVFALQLDPMQPSGMYQGFVTFTGQATTDYPNGDDIELGTGSITLNVPAAVPEASTTVSFGLLLMLGLGGMAVAAKRKKSAASA